MDEQYSEYHTHEEPKMTHRKYDVTMRRRVKRVKEKARSRRRFLLFLTGTCVVLVVAAVVWDNLIEPQLWPKVLALSFLIMWLALYSRFLLPFRISIRCTACDEQINLNQDWMCGWCEDEKTSVLMQTLVSYRVPLEACKECDEVAIAVECPYCGEDTVFNVDAYNREQDVGASKPGVARML